MQATTTRLTGEQAAEARRERGLRIATRMRIKALPRGVFAVPSESPGTPDYVVKQDSRGTVCSCPDWELRREPCKHVYAVEYQRRSETMADGSAKIVETLKVTYRQDWPAYNLAQTHEKQHAMEMLRALCDGIVEPPRERKRGNQPLSVKDRVFAMVAKVYCGMSTRRNDTDTREHAAKGYLERPISYNAIIDAMDDASLTPILMALITESAKPLRSVESQFAVDSTGFTTCTYKRWFDEKYGRERSEQQWVKGHANIGCKTNVIVAAKVTFGPGNDHPEFIPLLDATAPHFDMQEVSADKAYLSNANMQHVESLNAVPYIAFKTNSRGDAPLSTPIWRKMFNLFEMQKDEWMRSYHQRSNVEATFSMCKRKFGPALRSKTHTAQENEVLAKFLCHNLAVLVHAIYEFGVSALFWQPASEPTITPSTGTWSDIEVSSEWGGSAP